MSPDLNGMPRPPKKTRKNRASRSRPRRRPRPLSFDALESRRVLATFMVNTAADTVDQIPGDGLAADSLGLTSLRAAVMEANALPGDHTIVLTGDVELNLTSITGGDEVLVDSFSDASNDLDISDSGQITILGHGAAITAAFEVAGHDTRIFDLQPGAQLLLDQVRLSGGNVGLTSNLELYGGGAIRARDALLTINQSSLTNNRATLGGGAIDAQASMVAITQTTISGNRQLDSEVYSNQLAGGGGIRLTDCSRLRIATSTIADNQATTGGGVFVDSQYYCYGATDGMKEISIADSTIRDNVAQRQGGGLFVAGRPDAWLELILTGSTISGNAAGEGGGVWLQFEQPYHEARFANVTISGNAALERGGGLFLNADSYDSISLEHVTVAGNGGSTGGIDSAGQPVRIRNSIFADNGQVDAAGSFFSTGVNLVEQPGESLGLTPADLLFVDPLLLPLADNAWITQTQFLDVASPAIDRASLSTVAIDQLRRARVGVADLGATERIDDGTIAGTVTQNGRPFSNTNVELVRDVNGNGLVDGPDIIVASTNTDSSGRYQFSDLPPGSYLVSVLNQQQAAILQANLLTTIDSFEITEQAVVASNGMAGESVASAIEAVGLERTLQLDAPVGAALLDVKNGRLRLTADVAAPLTTNLIWNGLDELGPFKLDLSIASATAGLRTVYTAPGGVESIRAILTSADGGVSEIASLLPPNDVPTEWFLPFADLVPLQGSGVDLSQITEVRLELSGQLATGTSLEYLDVFAPAVAELHFEVPNAAPLATDDEASGDEDTDLTGNVSLNDSDPNSDPLVYMIATLPEQGSVELQPDGSFVYTPDANFFGDDSFTYRVSDGFGGEATATVSLTVRSVNDLPVVMNQTVMVQEDTSFTGMLAVVDVDNNLLHFQLTEAPEHGEVVFVNATREFTYVPAANFFGNDSFTYSVDDGSGTLVPGTVTLQIEGVNDDPTASDLTFSTLEDTVFQASLGVMDVDGDSGEYDVIQQPTRGSVTIDPTGQFTFVPALNVYGTDQFQYTFDDLNGGLVSRTVTLNVRPDGAEVSGFLYDDANRDGQRQPTEAGLPNRVVFIDSNGNGMLDRNEMRTFSDAGGYYFFPDVPDGNQDVAISLDGGDGQTSPLGGFRGDSAPITQLMRSMTPLDVDRDGDLDLVVTGELDGELVVALNDGDGHFQRGAAVSVGVRPHTVRSADFNGDGIGDLIVTVTGVERFPDSSQVLLLLGHGDGTFSITQRLDAGQGPLHAVVIDTDNDSDLDVAITSYRSQEVVILENDGRGRLTVGQHIPIAGQPISVAAGDVNGDGLPDLVVADYLADEVVLLTNQQGIFSVAGIVARGLGPSYVHLEDLNGDNVLDLGVTYYGRADGESTNFMANDSVAILSGDGQGGFTSSQPLLQLPAGARAPYLTFADMDLDGDKDMLVVESEREVISVFANVAGQFARSASQQFVLGPVGSAGPEWVVVGNFNRDGNPDVVASTLQGDVRMFLRAPGTLSIETTTGQIISEQNFGLVPSLRTPVATAPLSAAATAGHNLSLPTDVNRDAMVTPLDALLVINCLNDHASGQAAADAMQSMYADVNDDGWITPLDALLIINALSTSPQAAASSAAIVTQDTSRTGKAQPWMTAETETDTAVSARNSQETASNAAWPAGLAALNNQPVAAARGPRSWPGSSEDEDQDHVRAS